MFKGEQTLPEFTFMKYKQNLIASKHTLFFMFSAFINITHKQPRFFGSVRVWVGETCKLCNVVLRNQVQIDSDYNCVLKIGNLNFFCC